MTAIVTALAGIVGTDHVRTGEALAGHADPYAFDEPDGTGPAAAVLPGSVEEIQAIVALANTGDGAPPTASTDSTCSSNGHFPSSAKASSGYARSTNPI